MRVAGILLLTLACTAWAQEAQKPESIPGRPGPSVGSGSTAPQAERVDATKPAPPDRDATPVAEGSMAPSQVKELLHKVWLAQFRINDLLGEVRPERWKLPEATRNSFEQTLATLRQQLKALEGWRSQFDERPESKYLAYETYLAINAVLPRLDGVARSITLHENPSFGLQFSQAGNQLFDLQQTLGMYLGSLLRSEHQTLEALQSALAACHNELSYVMRGKSPPAKPMKNILPEFKGRRVRSRAAQAEPSTESKAARPGNSEPNKH